MGEDFAVLLCLFAGEFVVLAADGEVVLVFGLGGLQIGLYARDGGVKSSHSHTVMTVQARVSRRWALSSSQSMLRATFSHQNCSLVLGTVYLVQPR
mgnify:CR=1 FL=1